MILCIPDMVIQTHQHRKLLRDGLEIWQTVSNKTIKNSVNATGFAADPSSGHVAMHDVYGEAFLQAWETHLRMK